MNTKQLFKKGITLSAAAALFTLGACQGKAADVSKEDAYAQLKSALTTTVETNELSVSIRGNFTSRTPVSDESDGSAASLSSEENKGTIDISLQMKTDEERKITAQSAWIKLLDENDGSGLILESYYKDKNAYSYSNFIQESYSYAADQAPDTFDPSDIGIEDFSASVDKVLEVVPEAKATLEDGEYKLVWNVNNDNLNQYIEAYLWVNSENTPATEEQVKEQASEIAKDITVGGDTSLTVKIKESTITSISVVFDVTYQGSRIKGEGAFEMSVKNVTITYPEGRLEEIKQKAEAER